jgi:hypothetical protein
MRVAWTLLFDMSLKKSQVFKKIMRVAKFLLGKIPFNKTITCVMSIWKKHMKNNIVIRQSFNSFPIRKNLIAFTTI